MDKNTTEKKMILYRGSLKSCNYACSYCPFSKHPALHRELDKDRMEWMRFTESLIERAGSLGPFALMVVPYGEALIHSWYWEGLGKLSALEEIEAVGAQTNFSFSLNHALKYLERGGGNREKFRLWATFHPEMLSAEEFAEQCKAVQDEGISICAGAVGVPGNLPLLEKLRALLPASVYLWINRMDGLKRPYTPQEEQAFSLLDPCFGREQAWIEAQAERCHNRLLVEGNGRMHTCNISGPLPGNWYQEDFVFPLPKCRRNVCSCYLAYGGRDDMANRLLFGPYPLFRQLRSFSAAFLDIDGTLIPEGKSKVSPLTAASLQALKERGTRLFFATSLPQEEAWKKCREIWPLFEGGIFAGGAHLVGREEIIYPLEEGILSWMEERKAHLRFRLSACRKKGILYKITLSRPRAVCWKDEEETALCRELPETLRSRVRFIREGHCMQIIAAGTGKAEGVAKICRNLGISPREAVAIGDSAEDEAMMALCGKD